MMDSTEILKLILPAYLVEHFNIIKIEELETKLHIYFEEKNDYGNQCPERQLISKGFHSMITIEDFPLRGKSVKLHVQRRRWTDKQTGEIISRDWNIIAEGTRMTTEFSEFLKKISQY